MKNYSSENFSSLWVTSKKTGWKEVWVKKGGESVTDVFGPPQHLRSSQHQKTHRSFQVSSYPQPTLGQILSKMAQLWLQALCQEAFSVLTHRPTVICGTLSQRPILGKPGSEVPNVTSTVLILFLPLYQIFLEFNISVLCWCWSC